MFHYNICPAIIVPGGSFCRQVQVKEDMKKNAIQALLLLLKDRALIVTLHLIKCAV